MDHDGARHRLPAQRSVRTRIAVAILGVTALTLVVLGVPLAVVAQRFYQGRAVVELQRRAALAVGEVTLPLDATVLRSALTEHDDPAGVTVYDSGGHRLVGPGPDTADAAVRQALNGQPAARSAGGDQVVATPINDRSTERVVGAVRVTTRQGTITAKVQRAWAAMAATALLAIGGAWLVASLLARHLAAPIERLGERARALGHAAVLAPTEPSGVVEIDDVDRVLVESAVRISQALARERAFSSEVSHQIRTPLTRLSLFVDRARGERDPGPTLAQIDGEVAQLHDVTEHLLALARGRAPVPTSLDPNGVLDRLDGRWRPVASRLGRPFTVTRTDNIDAVLASPGALDQVLDVLIDNGFVHGAGTVSVHARRTAAGVVFEVSDEGPGLAAQGGADVFASRPGDEGRPIRHGIGLPLARAIVEADDGRLLLARERPPLFQIVLRLAPQDDPDRAC